MYDTNKLLAASIQLCASNRADDFESLYRVSLHRVACTRDIDFSRCNDTVVLHVLGGGAIPYKVGSRLLLQSYIGSHVSIGLYKKQR